MPVLDVAELHEALQLPCFQQGMLLTMKAKKKKRTERALVQSAKHLLPCWSGPDFDALTDILSPFIQPLSKAQVHVKSAGHEPQARPRPPPFYLPEQDDEARAGYPARVAAGRVQLVAGGARLAVAGPGSML